MPPGREREGRSGEPTEPPVVAVALGSNLGDRGENLRFGLRELERQLERLRVSRVYRSHPREGVPGNDFLNMCVAGRRPRNSGADDPRELLRQLLFIEMGSGRPAGDRRGGARTLDLDLLLVGTRSVRTGSLRLPHPRLPHRDFVLRPLAELLPGWRHPETGSTVEEMAADLGEEEARPLRSVFMTGTDGG